jgi:antitoxin (DNA-binding transcriptional repressor) of toxin-antitoxin stability system
MKSLNVGQIKTHFSELLSLVKKGEKIEVLFGKAKKPIAMIVPIEEKRSKRKLGLLEGKASFSMIGDGKITEAEFLGI